MAILDIFKLNEFKIQVNDLSQRNEQLEIENKEFFDKTEKQLSAIEKYKEQVANLENSNKNLIEDNKIKLSLQQMKPQKLEELINQKQDQLKQLEADILTAEKNLSDTLAQVSIREQEFYELDAQVGDLQARNEMAGFGLPEPLYDFATSSEYKDELAAIREEQKDDIRSGYAYTNDEGWTVNNSLAKGRQMIKREVKSLFRSFNNECTNAINKVTISNYDRIVTRIQKSFEQHNKMHKEPSITIDESFLKLKLDELNLAFSYQKKKQEEKDILREQRAREKEERKAQKEYEEEQKKLVKEVSHYQNAITELTDKLDNSTDDREDLEKEIQALKVKLSEYQAKQNDLDYRADNITAGYVYIISNIGSFGHNVVKIGVTRRLDPLERISELSSASVPFKFDVHALIFSEDAYALETKLHQRFNDQRINKVNNRKEYFNISIDEIKKELENYKDVTVDFHESPEAAEYRESLTLTS